MLVPEVAGEPVAEHDDREAAPVALGIPDEAMCPRRLILRASLGTRGRIACWLDVRDDPALGEALAALITEEEPATAKAGLSGPGSPAGSAPLPG